MLLNIFLLNLIELILDLTAGHISNIQSLMRRYINRKVQIAISIMHQDMITATSHDLYMLYSVWGQIPYQQKENGGFQYFNQIFSFYLLFRLNCQSVTSYYYSMNDTQLPFRRRLFKYHNKQINQLTRKFRNSVFIFHCSVRRLNIASNMAVLKVAQRLPLA